MSDPPEGSSSRERPDRKGKAKAWWNGTSASANGSNGSSSRVRAWPDRNDRTQQWWGEFHDIPEHGDVDRLRMFVQPQNMGQDEQDKIIQEWKNTVSGQDNEKTLGMSHHLRPSTPRSKRIDKQVRRLQDNQHEISEETRARMKEVYGASSGVLESLKHYCQDEEQVPVGYVNQLVQMTDQLILETAKQLDLKCRQHRAEVEELEAQIHDLSQAQPTNGQPQSKAGNGQPDTAPENGQSEADSGKREPKEEVKWWKQAEADMQNTINDLVKQVDKITKELEETRRKLQAAKNKNRKNDSTSGSSDQPPRSRAKFSIRKMSTMLSRTPHPHHP